jgi:hypothetical protein
MLPARNLLRRLRHRPVLRTGRWAGRSVTAKDLRPPPLSERKAKLARLPARAPTGIVFNDHTEDGAVKT